MRKIYEIALTLICRLSHATHDFDDNAIDVSFRLLLDVQRFALSLWQTYAEPLRERRCDIAHIHEAEIATRGNAFALDQKRRALIGTRGIVTVHAQIVRRRR